MSNDDFEGMHLDDDADITVAECLQLTTGITAAYMAFAAVVSKLSPKWGFRVIIGCVAGMLVYAGIVTEDWYIEQHGEIDLEEYR